MYRSNFGAVRVFHLTRMALVLWVLSCAGLPADTIILRGSGWKYDDSGADLGTAWKELSYSETGWHAASPAQLGYGDGDEATTISYGPDPNNKYITYYFRQSFFAPDPPPYASLKLRVVRDDGCVVYINGTEVARSNMPAGSIGYSTLASAAIGGTDESAWNEFVVDPEVLAGTTNVMAVEVHQSGVTSTDLSFDLELEGLPPVPSVTLQSPPDQSTVNSTTVDFQCLAADTVGLESATLYMGSQPETLVLSGPQNSIDTVIRDDAPNTNYGTATTTKVDGLSPHAHSLVKFPDLVGTGPAQVRPFATVVSATLQVNCTNASGDLIQIHRLIQDWTEDGATWNNRTAGEAWSTPGADGPYSRAMTAYDGDCSAVGSRAFNVTAIVQEWVSGAQNFGFFLADSGDDGVDFDTSESSNPPVLTVEYQPDWRSVDTQSISGTSAGVTFTVEGLTDGQGYTWNCLVTNTFGQQSWAPADFHVIVDASSPDVPALVGPAHDEQGVSISPILEVTVSDPNDDDLDVTFYGRATSSDAEEFTIVTLPDTQNYSLSYPDVFTAQTQWVANNASSRSIVFTTHVGDVVNDNTVDEWIRANTSMSILDGVVPYGIAVGNHDELDPGTIRFNTYFPYTRFENLPWYGGHYGTSNDDSYQLFSAGGVDFIVLHLDFCPSSTIIDWADSVLETYSDRKAIITTHGYMDTSGNRNVSTCGSTQYIWDSLVLPNDNVYFILCGHVAGEYARTDLVNGRQVHQLLADYQGLTPYGGNGYLRILRFSPAEDKVFVETYSPWLDYSYQLDANSQFSLDFPMAPPYSAIGTVTGVSSGSTASLVWLDLAPNTEYEWYVEATDPTGKKTASPAWRFRTGSGDSTPPAISQVAVTDVKAAIATVTWATDEPADSLVEYGLDTSYGSQVADASLVTAHSILLTGLTAGTLYHYRVTSEDASGNSASSLDGTFTTNRPPVADVQSVNTDEETVLPVALSATDDDGDSLTYEVVDNPAHGSLLGTAPELTYTPDLDFNGPDSFTFKASDGKDDSNTATVTITVNSVNDAPEAAPDSYMVDQNATLEVAVPGVLGNDTDPDTEDTLTAVLVIAPANGQLVLNADGSFSYLASGPVATETFSYAARDAVGATSAATVTIQVLPVNHAPTADGDAYDTDEDLTLTVAAPGVLSNDEDADPGDTLSAVLGSGPANGTLTINPDGSFTYVPASNWSGTDSFTYHAWDQRADSNDAMVSITVAPVNDAPVAAAGTATTSEDTSVDIVLQATDAEGAQLTYAIVVDPTHGNLTGAAPDLIYTPDANYYGPDTFTFKANDQIVDSNVATVNITVTAVNDAPVAVDGAASTSEDTAVAIHLQASDAELSVLTYYVANPSHGTLSGTAPDLTYTPTLDYSGPDSFTFQASDGTLDSNVATVSITVGPAADPPTTPQGLTATAGNTTVSLDWDDSSDPDGNLQGYKVYRSTTAATYGEPIATVSSSEYVDGGVANGTTYYYVVKAEDAGGLLSAASNEVSAAPTDTIYDAYAAANPTIAYGTLGGSGISGTHVAGDGLTQTITEVPAGTGGRSRLQAEYSLHTTAPANQVSSLVLYLSSTWTSLDAGDPLVVSLWNGTAWEDITAAIQGGSLAPAAPQSYIDASGNIRVRFADTSALKGEGKDTLAVDLLYAHVVAGPPDTTPPAAPTGLTSTPVSAEVLVELYWTANAEPDLAGYKVYRSTTPGAGYEALTPSPIAGTTYIDPVPAPGTYYYVVRAVDASANESPASNEASATVDDLPPAAPAGLTATAGDAQVTLAWTANPEPDVAGYNVHRSGTPGGPYSKINQAPVASPSYLDTGLVNGTQYFYVVTAVDAAASESGYSAEASATPAAQTSTVHVQAIAMSIAKVSSKNWQATAAVTIADQAGAPRQGATVVGDWYFKGAIAQSGVSGATDATGKATIASPSKPAKTGDVFRFVVTGVTLAGSTYNPAQNVVTEGSVAVP